MSANFCNLEQARALRKEGGMKPPKKLYWCRELKARLNTKCKPSVCDVAYVPQGQELRRLEKNIIKWMHSGLISDAGKGSLIIVLRLIEKMKEAAK